MDLFIIFICALSLAHFGMTEKLYSSLQNRDMEHFIRCIFWASDHKLEKI